MGGCWGWRGRIGKQDGPDGKRVDERTRLCNRCTRAHWVAGQAVGIKEVHDEIWLVSFMDYDLGYFDLDRFRIANDSPSD
jgi:hypothetical protein